MGKSYSEKVKARIDRERSQRNADRPSSRRNIKDESPPFPWAPFIMIGIVISLIALGVVMYAITGDDGSGSVSDNDRPEDDGSSDIPDQRTRGEILLDTTEGSELFLDQFKGKVVLIDMFATWCGPCKTQMIELIELESRFSSEDLVILSIGADLSESMSLIRDFKAQEGGSWPFARSDPDFNSEFPASSIPTMYILARDGTTAQKHIGVTSVDALESEINELL